MQDAYLSDSRAKPDI